MQKEKSENKKKNFIQNVIDFDIKKEKSNVIKIENEDEFNDENNDMVCGVKDDFENLDLKQKKLKNKNICNKCKIAKSSYFVRNEFICQ